MFFSFCFDMAQSSDRALRQHVIAFQLTIPTQGRQSDLNICLYAINARYFLDQNLQLMLHGAQLALLQGKGDLFRGNLGQATEWVREYFDGNTPAVVEFLADLERIRDLNTDVPRPDISGGMVAFRQAESRDNNE